MHCAKPVVSLLMTIHHSRYLGYSRSAASLSSTNYEPVTDDTALKQD